MQVCCSCEAEIDHPESLDDFMRYEMLNGCGESTLRLSSLLRYGEPQVSESQCSQLGLNLSQAKAYISAISQELSIIQGKLN